MAKEPGNLNDLSGVGQDYWDTTMADMAVFIQDTNTQHLIGAATAGMTLDLVDWDGLPVRVQKCLQSRDRAMRVCDFTTSDGDLGRRICHEEYMEWRVVRDVTGKITRVEVTTEIMEYWQALAMHEPVKYMALVARFAGEPSVPVKDVYGAVNPFAPGVTPAQRRAGFRSVMLPPTRDDPARSPYNNGKKAICFLQQGANSLAAAVQLAAAAAFPYGVATPQGPRALTGAEAITSTPQSAVDCRNSDPTIVGALVGAAFQGKQIALDDPAGIYITNITHKQLVQPVAGRPRVPLDWFNLQRGAASADGRPRHQRLVFEVPPGLGFVVGDLIDSQTDETIDWGWQIAQLIKVGLYVRVSASGTVAGAPNLVPLSPPTDCSQQGECALFAALYQAAQPAPPPPVAASAPGSAVARDLTRKSR